MTTLPTTIQEPIELSTRAPASAGGGAAAVSFGDIVAILRRRAALITVLFLLLSSMAVGGWLLAWRVFPLYSAEAFVECISDVPKMGFMLTVDRPDQREQERFMATQAHHVTSLDVLMDVLKAPEVRGTQWFEDTPEADLVIDFLDLVRAAPLRGTNLLRIAVRTRSQKDPHLIVNQVVTHYLNKVREYSTGGYRTERRNYEDELEAISLEIVAKQQDLAKQAAKLPPGQASGAGNIVMQEYAVQRAIVTQYELETQELEGLSAIYNQPGGAGISPEDTQMVELDPQVAMLANQQFQYSQQLEVLRKRLGSNHRQIKQIEDYLDVIRRQLQDTRDRRLDEITVYKNEQVRTAFLNSQHALLLAREKLADLTATLADMDTTAAQYMALEEDIMLLKQNRVLIKEYIRELDRVVTEKSGIQVHLRQRALPPLQRAFPRTYLISAGIAFSLFMAIGIALLVEFVDTLLRTPQDIIRHLRTPLLGMVPDADDEEVEINEIERAVTEAPQSMFAEAFRAIRTNLQFAAPSERQRSIVITSPRPDDGKTTIACNLAAIVALGGRRVLLVDGNFRRPAIHRFFPVKSSGGLSNILVGGGSFRDYVNATEIPNLDVLGSGPLPPSPAELVGSQQMRDFIAEVTGLYDQVMIDAPPILLATDAALLASRTNGAILVIRANANSRGIGSRACSMLSHVNAHLFGTVLNAARVRRGGYFREQLRTFYDYRLEEEEEASRTERALPESDSSAPESESSGSEEPGRQDESTSHT